MRTPAIVLPERTVRSDRQRSQLGERDRLHIPLFDGDLSAVFRWVPNTFPADVSSEIQMYLQQEYSSDSAENHRLQWKSVHHGGRLRNAGA